MYRLAYLEHMRWRLPARCKVKYVRMSEKEKPVPEESPAPEPAGDVAEDQPAASSAPQAAETTAGDLEGEDGGYPQDWPLPPASFEFLVLSLRSQAEFQLGQVHFGEESQRPKPDFRLAQHTIDLLAMLAEKTKNNLSFEEKRLLENSLTELRFRYVDMKRRAEGAG